MDQAAARVTDLHIRPAPKHGGRSFIRDGGLFDGNRPAVWW